MDSLVSPRHDEEAGSAGWHYPQISVYGFIGAAAASRLLSLLMSPLFLFFSNLLSSFSFFFSLCAHSCLAFIAIYLFLNFLNFPPGAAFPFLAHRITSGQHSNLKFSMKSQFFLLLTADRGNHLLFPAPPRRPPAPICQKQLLVVVVGIERQVARGNRFRLNFQTVPLYLMHREAWFCLYCRYKAIKQNNLTKHVAAARNRPNPAAATTATTFATKTLEEKQNKDDQNGA